MTEESAIQRAIIFQGGGALGAYEAGVFKRLSDKIKQEEPKRIDRMFDIVAGTSAGAINAALLVSHVVKNKTWDGAAEKLVEFWKHLSIPTPQVTELGTAWWNLISNQMTNGTVASKEAARRYYSTKYFFTFGVPNVFLPQFPFPKLDNKFFDNNPGFPPTNLWFQYSNEQLKESLEHTNSAGEKFINFPISTNPDKKEPRLLAISVDVNEGKAVAFDSYSRQTTYQSYNPKSKKYVDHVMSYNEGIVSKHIMASASIPIHFGYQEIDKKQFCDGGLLSNTPLRELLQAHRDYWHKERKEKVPNLDVIIINVWPSMEMTSPSDYDGIKDRNNDITYSDKTEYDQKVALLVTDYVNFINKLKDLVDDAISLTPAPRTKLEDRLKKILSTETRSTKRTDQKRTYDDLTKGRFNLMKVTTIERNDDVNNISAKWADYTTESINRLIGEGENYTIVRVL